MKSSFFVQPEEQEVQPPPGFVLGESAVRGIDVYVPANPLHSLPEVMDFKCPHCGATIGYHVEEGQLVCDHCGYKEIPQPTRLGQAAETFEFVPETLERSERGWGEERKDMACQRCGGVVSMSCEILAYSCPFCGSNKVLYREPLEDILRPRYLIPFIATPQECKAIVRQWLGSSWMIPTELRGAVKPERFTPIYIPYWSFNATTKASWKAEVASNTTENFKDDGGPRHLDHTMWHDEAGKVQKPFSSLLVPATTRLNLSALAHVDTFDLNKLILYEPRYLAGIRAQAHDIPLEEGWTAARKIMRERTREACLDRATATAVRNFWMTLDFTDEQWRYILVPMYTSVYQYGDKTYQLLVNGQNGNTSGPRPVDWEKVWLVVAGLLSPGLLMMLVGWLFSSAGSGPYTGAIGLFLLVVGIVISYFIVRQAQEIENV